MIVKVPEVSGEEVLGNVEVNYSVVNSYSEVIDVENGEVKNVEVKIKRTAPGTTF